ncbi:MAG: hypothetical protein AAF518_28185 [Spirochaetota bacterium]
MNYRLKVFYSILPILTSLAFSILHAGDSQKKYNYTLGQANALLNVSGIDMLQLSLSKRLSNPRQMPIPYKEVLVGLQKSGELEKVIDLQRKNQIRNSVRTHKQSAKVIVSKVNGETLELKTLLGKPLLNVEIPYLKSVRFVRKISNGSFIVLGTLKSAIKYGGHRYAHKKGYGEVEAFLAKVGKKGKLLWTQEIGGRFKTKGYIGSHTRLLGMAIDTKGNTFLAGQSDARIRGVRYSSKTRKSISDFFYGKFTKNGKRVWLKIADSVSSRKGSIWDVSYDTKGTLYMVGNTPTSRCIVGSYSSNSKKRWLKILRPQKNNATCSSLVQSKNRKYIYLAGRIGKKSLKLYYPSNSRYLKTRNNPSRAFVAKYTINGKKMWIADYKTIDTISSPVDIMESADKNILVTGFACGNNIGIYRKLFLVKFSRKGKMIWKKNDIYPEIFRKTKQ